MTLRSVSRIALPTLVLGAALLALGACDAAYDPECLEAGKACQTDEECCSNQCVDSACTSADQGDPQ